MRRTWNSWTYYGLDNEQGASQPAATREDGSGYDALKQRRRRPGRPLRNGLNGSLQQPMEAALETARDLCDVRNERVVRVREAIEAGTYRVSAQELAHKLIENMLGEYR